MKAKRGIIPIAIIAVLLVSLFAPVTVSADEPQPVLPTSFYGDVTVNDIPAPIDTVITGRIVDAAGLPGEGTITVTVEGKYGGPGLATKLTVETNSPEDVDKDIEFYVQLPGWEEAIKATPDHPVVYDSHTHELSLNVTVWTITSSAGEWGSIDPSGEVVIGDGGSQAFTITPDANYEIEDVLVDGNSVGAVETYTFENVVTDHIIDATFTEVEAPLTEPNISVSPTSKNFGEITVDSSSSAQTFTVSNAGTANLVVGTITITGANQFAIQNDDCSGETIAQNGSATLQVVFSPTSTGAKSATLSIPSNDPNEATLEVSLSGTGVAVSDGGGRAAPPTYHTDTNLFGAEESFRISSSGKILETIEATSADGNLTITIPKDTVALDKDGKRLKSLEAAVDETPPDPPKDAHVIGLAYDFGPDGATFDPEITLEYSYDPANISEDIAEEDLVIAYYDEAIGEWVVLEGCVVDTENNTITAPISHFTTFAVIVEVPPVAEIKIEIIGPILAPAAFSLTDLSVTPVEVLTGEAVTITVPVANTGGTEGSYTVVLKINEVKEAEKSVTIAAGSIEVVTFSVTRKEVGSYTVTVDGLSASFAVVAVEEVEEVKEVPAVPAKPPGVSWPLIGGIIAAVVVVIGLIVFFQLRRRAYR